MPKRRQTRAGGRPRSGGRPRPGGQRPRGTASVPAGRPGTPAAGETRQAVERFSAQPLVFLYRLPRWIVLLAALALFITGFAVPGLIGAAALLLVAIFLSWLAYLSWPSISAWGRAGRVVGLVCMVVVVVWQARR